jgi:hypothetical protein
VLTHEEVFQQDLCQLVENLKELTFLNICGAVHNEKLKSYQSMVQARFPHSRSHVEISRVRLWL